MSLNCGSQGGKTVLLVEAHDGTFDSSSERYDFIAENLELVEYVVGDQGLTGGLDLSAAHIRNGPAYVRGSILMNISPKELDVWLPRILRGSESSNVHSPGDEDRGIDILIDRDQATFKYLNCKVDKALFRATSNLDGEPQLLEMLLTFIGEDEESGTMPETLPDPPSEDVLFWLMGDSVLTLNDVAYPFHAFNLMIDNMMVPKLRNSLRPICIDSAGRRVRFQPRIPLSSTSATNLYFTRLDGAGTLDFQSSKYMGDSDSSTIFTFERLYGKKITPRTAGRTETFLDLDLTAYPGDAPATDPVITVTNTFPAPA